METLLPNFENLVTEQSPFFIHYCNFLWCLQMRGAEVLKREGMKLWNKFKTGRPMLTEITKQLTALRDRLTRAEGVSSCSHSFCSFIRCFCHRICTGSAFSEFGYNERPAITNRSLCMKIIGCNVKRFGYNEHFP